MSTITKKTSTGLLFVPTKPVSSLEKRTFKLLAESPISQIVHSLLRDKQKSLVLTPELTGKYLVGHTFFVVKGPKNLIGIELFAPTESFDGMELAEYELFPGHPLSSDKRLSTRSYEGINPIANKLFPTVIISHGFGLEPSEYRPLAEEIASHGYVVLALSHPYSAAYAPFEPSIEIDELPCSKVSSKQAKDIAYIINAAREKKIESLKTLAKIADFNSITLIGHALGGTAAIMVARKDPTIRACINIDGPLYGMTDALKTPVLTLISGHKYNDPLSAEQKDDVAAMDDDWKAFHKASPHSTLTILKEADHDDFLLFPLLKEALESGYNAARCRETLSRAAKAILSFIEPFSLIRFPEENESMRS